MKPLNILLAEDTESVGLFVASYLRDSGHRVTYVRSGEEAVTAYPTEDFDLVLMDVVMPGIGGLEAIRQIKTHPTRRWVPIIIITGLGEEGDILAGHLAGADDYMLKPLNPLTLDIRIRAMMRIAAIQRSTSAIVENVIEGIVQIDRSGRIRFFNHAAEQMFGYQESEVIGRNVNLLMPSPYREAHDEYIANYLASGEPKVIGIGRKVTGLRKNGETFPLHLGITEAHTPDGKFFVGLVRDLTEEERMRDRIEYLAQHDPLTGLPNRRVCLQRLMERYAIKNGGHGPADCSVLYCDLDGFKQINDSCGHAAGDQVLKETARRMKDSLFVRDFVSRMGGDEFVMVVDGAVEDDKAAALAQRIIERVSQPIETASGLQRVGASIGIAHSRQHPESVESIINAADEAMYRSKKAGKGRYEIG